MGKYSAARDLDLTIKAKWVLIANRASARILKRKSMNNYDEIARFENPKAKTRKPDLVFDKAEVADIFASRLAKTLDSAVKEGKFTELVVVAEPRFLGKLRAFLSLNVKERIVSTIHKDLGRVLNRQIFEVLSQV